jgi:hypothetical protein
MNDVGSEIQEIVDRETRAWDTQDADLLLSVFHPDMVWPWPKSSSSHDPMEWVLEGVATTPRGGDEGGRSCSTHSLIRNDRETKKIEVLQEGDGAFAVVDIDTLWRSPLGEEMRWQGRVCKVYTKVGGEWKMTMHTGVLVYP